MPNEKSISGILSISNSSHPAYLKNKKIPFSFENEPKEALLSFFRANLGKDESINICAGLGFGKTDSAIETCYEKQQKAILLVPLQLLARQKYEKYKNKYNLGLIHGRRSLIKQSHDYISSNKIGKMIQDENVKVIICVYNSFPKLFEIESFEPSQYILIIDEAHNLVSQIDFRFDVINYISERKSSFKQVITLTGTPEGTIFFKGNYYFLESHRHQNPPRLFLVPYEKEGIVKLFNLLMENKREKNIVVIDNLLRLKKLSLLLRRFGVSSKNIAVFSSETKHCDDFLYVEKHQRLPKNIQFILTTRVSAEGASIFETQKPIIYFLDSNDVIMKRQFVHRFREGTKRIYDLLSYNSKTEKEVFDIYSKYKVLTDLYKKQLNTSIQIIKANEDLGSNSSLNFGKEKGSYIYKSKIDSKLKVSNELIANRLLKELNSIITSDIEKSETYYKDIAGFETLTADYSNLVSKEVLTQDSYLQLMKSSKELSNIGYIEFIQNNFSYLFSVHTKRRSKLKNKNLIDPSLFRFNNNKMFNHELTILSNDKKLQKKFDYLLKIAVKGFPKKFLLNSFELLENQRNIVFAYQLERIYYHVDWQISSLLQDYRLENTPLPEFKYYRQILNLYKVLESKESINLKEFQETFNSTFDKKHRPNPYSHSSFIHAIFEISGRKQINISRDDNDHRKVGYVSKLLKEQSFDVLLNYPYLKSKGSDFPVLHPFSSNESYLLLEKLLKIRLNYLLDHSNLDLNFPIAYKKIKDITNDQIFII